MFWEEAHKIAFRIKTELFGYCERIETAGSIRRGKESVKDIEIVCMPRNEPHFDLFGESTAHYPLLDFLCGKFLDGKEKIKGAEKYFQFWLKSEEIALDLFIVTPPAQWGVIYVIRTGPSEFSHWAVTPGIGGLPSDCIVKQGGVYRGDKLVPMPEESDFLQFLKLGWIEPKERVPRWKQNG